MSKTPVLALALMSAIMIPAIQQLHAAPQTIDGVVTDSMCGKKAAPEDYWGRQRELDPGPRGGRKRVLHWHGW